jgi:hypothetical protein
MKQIACRSCGLPFDRNRAQIIHCSEACCLEDKIDRSPGHGPHGDCWLWVGALNDSGYGILTFMKRKERAHRPAFRIFCDHAPGNLEVCHSCDNPACVNPRHLFLATHAANVLDMNRKGRQARGEQKSPLSEEQVLAIRRGGRRRLSDLSARYGVSISCIERVATGRRWQHLDAIAPPWPPKTKRGPGSVRPG